MALPYFFVNELNGPTVVMDEDASKHIISVLRMQKQEPLLLTNGKGKKAKGLIQDDNRKKCIIAIDAIETQERMTPPVTIAVSLVKNTARMEWFLEKATEMGVGTIIPLVCERTIREKFRRDRLEQILISAMLQSQQCWLPQLHEPTAFAKVLETNVDHKFIAWCEEKTQQLQPPAPGTSSLLLIGPEGDFTQAEVNAALANGFQAVSLGPTRLRTETAALVAAALLCLSPR